VPAELTARELLGAAQRAENPVAEARWLARAFLEFRFHEQVAGQVDVTLQLIGLARAHVTLEQRMNDPQTWFAAYATDGILASMAYHPLAPRQLTRAANLFRTTGLRHDPLWVEVMAHVHLASGTEGQVRDLMRMVMGDTAVGPPDRQRLECVLGVAELRVGQCVHAAAAFNEAALPSAMVDEHRRDWASHMLTRTGERSPESWSPEELRVIAAFAEGLTAPETADRLAITERSVEFYRHELQRKLGPDERIA
jgi:DNA-binding CsgD family transcriptional regulator